MEIKSHNEVHLTGLVTSVKIEDGPGTPLAIITLVTATTFLRLRGYVDTETTTHKALVWQLHNKKNILKIHEGSFISLTGEYKRQRLFDERKGHWVSELCIFVLDFEIVGEYKDGCRLIPEQSRAQYFKPLPEGWPLQKPKNK